MNTFLYISCFTSDFDIMRTKWELKKTGKKFNPAQQYRFDNQAGSILTYDWISDKIIAETIQSCPFGMYLYENKLFVCDAKLNAIIIYDSTTLKTIATINSKMFNDIHSLTRWGDSLLVSSTGVDAVLAVSLKDYSVRPIVVFAEGDNELMLSVRPEWINDHERDFSKDHIATEAQLTHLNYAAPLRDGRIGISLFHQGKIVAYDEQKQQVTPIVNDLYRSHSFFELKEYLFVADSGNHCVKIYDQESLELQSSIPQKGWVQDIRYLIIDGGNLMAVADADNSLITIYDLDIMKPVRTIQLDKKYRISSCELLLK